MGGFAASLDHLKNHVEYPADAETVVTACNNMSEASTEDSEWFAKTLPGFAINASHRFSSSRFVGMYLAFLREWTSRNQWNQLPEYGA